MGKLASADWQLRDGKTMSKVCRSIRTVLLIGSLTLGACGKKDDRPGRVPVTGAVLRAGQAVADATVIFEPLGNTPAATGTTDSAGRFVLSTFGADDGAVPGEYKVAVRKVQVIRTARPADAPDDLVTPPPEEKWLLPAKYGDTTTSGFTASVKAEAQNDFKFEIAD
jgi:hypothetical protein